jgi:ribosome recycling factor
MEKDKKISEDELHNGLDRIQKLTDAYVAKVGEILERKEKEILEV